MFRTILLNGLTLFLLFCLAGRAAAHIEADMPDPIAEIEYLMMLEFEPDDSITRYKLAMVYYRLNKDSAAETELTRVLHDHPKYFHALEGMGMLKLRQEKFSEAIAYLEKAIQQKESESGTYYYLGMAKKGLKDFNGAKTAFASGLEKCLTEKEADRAIQVEQFKEALGSTDT